MNAETHRDWFRITDTVILWLLDLSFLIALAAIPVLWVMSPERLAIGGVLKTHWGARTILAPVILLLARVMIYGVARRYSAMRLQAGWERLGFRRFVLGLVVTYGVFGVFEAVLRWTGFEATLPPVLIVGRNEQGRVVENDSMSDPELIYRLVPGNMLAGRRINRLGFREREIDPVKAPGVIRVICMGDSITAQGLPPYSQILHAMLAELPPTTAAWEAFNMGVHGYTALQGLRLFQIQARDLKPDIVTIFYGWNDHWLAPEPDRQKMALEMRPAPARFFEMLRRKRLFQFLVWCLNPVDHLARLEAHGVFHAPLQEGAADLAAFQGRVLRVDEREYHDTLRAFVREVRTSGAIPILITAPSRKLRADIVRKHFATSTGEGRRIHERYVAVTRDVARETGTPLLDLADLLAGPACDGLFANDGIHFGEYEREDELEGQTPDQPGLRRVASEIASALHTIVRSPEWKAREVQRRQSSATPALPPPTKSPNGIVAL